MYRWHCVAQSGDTFKVAFMLQSRFPHVAGWVGRLKRVPGWGDPYDVLSGPKIAPKW